MTRQDLIHKWAVYALALLPVWLLDSCILPRFPLFGVTPMLLPLALTAVAVLEGSGAGGGFGLAVGLVWTLSYPLGWGGTVLGMTLAGAAIGGVSQYVLSQSLPGCMLCGAGLLAVLDGRLGRLEDHIARREFTREVELDLLIGIIADVVEVDRDDLKRKRAQSVRNVKATNGLISLEKRARSAGEPDWDGDEWQD